MQKTTLLFCFLAILLFCANVFAQEGLVDGDPTKSSCLDPNTKQWECPPLVPMVTVKELLCSAEEMGKATFKLCNTESVPVVAVEIDRSSQNYIVQAEPRLPLTIEPGQCVDVVVQGIERQDTVEKCNPESKFCLTAYSKAKPPGFNCSGDYGFGYNFISQSEHLQGKGAFVPLYTPQKSGDENEQ